MGPSLGVTFEGLKEITFYMFSELEKRVKMKVDASPGKPKKKSRDSGHKELKRLHSSINYDARGKKTNVLRGELMVLK